MIRAAVGVVLGLALQLGACAAIPKHRETPTPPTVRVAVCQTLCIDSDIEGNLRRIEYATEQAAAAGAQLACFPEAAVVGWVNPDAHTLAAPIPGVLTDRLGEIARRHGVMLATGLCERDGDDLYDSAVLLSAEGEVLLRHRKINTLDGLMEPPYARGRVEDIQTADTPLGRIGMLVCADCFIESHTRALAAGQPDLVIVPYGWAAPAEDWPEHGASLEAWVRAVAQRTGAPVVGPDAVGQISSGAWAGMVYGGQSVVVDREGGTMGVLRDRDPEVRVFDVPLPARGHQE